MADTTKSAARRYAATVSTPASAESEAAAMMTFDEKKAFLQSYRDIIGMIDELGREYGQWSELCERQISGSAGAKIRVMTIIISNELDKLIAMREIIMAEIAALPGTKLMRIIYLKYIKCMTFEQIGEDYGYSTRQVMRLHNEAVGRMFEKGCPRF